MLHLIATYALDYAYGSTYALGHDMGTIFISAVCLLGWVVDKIQGV